LRRHERFFDAARRRCAAAIPPMPLFRHCRVRFEVAGDTLLIPDFRRRAVTVKAE